MSRIAFPFCLIGADAGQSPMKVVGSKAFWDNRIARDPTHEHD
jgi:hypothetical protein